MNDAIAYMVARWPIFLGIPLCVAVVVILVSPSHLSKALWGMIVGSVRALRSEISAFFGKDMSLLFALLGLLAGALVNRLATDLPVHRGLTLPHCSYCRQARPWWQWVSLPAFIVGRAKCPLCGARVPLRYPLVELALAVAYAYLWVLLGPSLQLALYAIYTAILAIVLVTDLEYHLIPNAVMLPAILLAIAASFIPGQVWWRMLLGGVFCLAPFVVAKVIGGVLFGGGSLGGGDLKLALFVGLITGLPRAFLALMLATVLGAVVALVLLASRRRGWLDAVPYGPFLVAGGWVALVWGPWILTRMLAN
jgi:leader peptidase (prepilin peptidase)/N-methyltransferase